MGSETLIQRLGSMDGLLNPKQLSSIFCIHITTLQNWTKRGEIPFLKIGHAIRFDPVQLAAWLTKRQMGVHSRE
jgi:excisionase family DNA binding protein